MGKPQDLVWPEGLSKLIKFDYTIETLTKKNYRLLRIRVHESPKPYESIIYSIALFTILLTIFVYLPVKSPVRISSLSSVLPFTLHSSTPYKAVVLNISGTILTSIPSTPS
jgi:hypothetical protein